MLRIPTSLLLIAALSFTGCVGDATPTPDDNKNSGAPQKKAAAPAADDWVDGGTIDSGLAGMPAVKILKVHKNGSGPRCGSGKKATLRYKAMKSNGEVVDPGTRPFSFTVGRGQAIKGWDVIVAKMRIGDSFTVMVPEQLAYRNGDMKFDMELLTVE